MTIEEKIDELIAGISGDVYDYADSDYGDSDRNEAVYSATKSYKQAILALIKEEAIKARIDELEGVFVDDGYDIRAGAVKLDKVNRYCYLDERITQLQAELKEVIRGVIK